MLSWPYRSRSFDDSTNKATLISVTSCFLDSLSCLDLATFTLQDLSGNGRFVISFNTSVSIPGRPPASFAIYYQYWFNPVGGYAGGINPAGGLNVGTNIPSALLLITGDPISLNANFDSSFAAITTSATGAATTSETETTSWTPSTST